MQAVASQPRIAAPVHAKRPLHLTTSHLISKPASVLRTQGTHAAGKSVPVRAATDRWSPGPPRRSAPTRMERPALPMHPLPALRTFPPHFRARRNDEERRRQPKLGIKTFPGCSRVVSKHHVHQKSCKRMAKRLGGRGGSASRTIRSSLAIGRVGGFLDFSPSTRRDGERGPPLDRPSRLPKRQMARPKASRTMSVT